MNKSRRQKISSAKDLLTRASEIVSLVYDSETDALDSIPDNLQGSERYETSENACYALECAQDYIDDAIEKLNDAMI